MSSRCVRRIFSVPSTKPPKAVNAHSVFDFCKLPQERRSLWSSSSSGNGSREHKVGIFGKMIPERYIELNADAMIDMLRSSVDLGVLDFGRSVHGLVITSSLSDNLSVSTNVLSMYSKLRNLKNARLVFDRMPQRDCVVWNVMISAYSQLRKPMECIQLVRSMAKSGIRADMFTAIPSISAVRQLKSGRQGKQMHAHVMRNATDYQVSVHNALVDMYCQCGCLSYARKIFDKMNEKTAVSWSSMIKGYITHDNNLEALSLFSKMKSSDVTVDFVAVINILPACVNIGALEQVKHLHGFSVKLGLNLLSSVNSALLISYAKCGCIEMARNLFDEEEINCKDIITWNSMITAYSRHGDWHQCFQMYRHMKQLALKPDQVTFLAVLTACVNSGLVKEGKQLFKEMKEIYGCQPNQEHYACMVDLLGRTGHLVEARELVRDMPFEPDARTWGPLLSACKKHSETNNVEFAAEKLIKLDSRNAGNYVLLSSIYAAAGKWDKFAETRRLLKERGLKKTPGISWLEIDGRMHQFVVADHSHPKAEAIFQLLGIIDLEIKKSKKKKRIRKQEPLISISPHHNFYLDRPNTIRKSCLERWLTSIGDDWVRGDDEQLPVIGEIAAHLRLSTAAAIDLFQNLQELCSRSLRRRESYNYIRRDWQNLPPEITTQILSRIGPVNLTLNARRVCSSWFNISEDPCLWCSVVFSRPRVRRRVTFSVMERIYALAIRTSGGGLESVTNEEFCTDELLLYIARW